MTDIFAEKRAEALSFLERMGPPQMSWWLSFAGEQFRGVVVVDLDDPRGDGFLAALTQANIAGVNPGGEVAGYPIQWADVPEGERHEFFSLPRLTLITREDLAARGGYVTIDGDPVTALPSGTEE